MSENIKTFSESLFINKTNRISNELKQVYEEHISDNNEVLIYLLISDYTRYIESIIYDLSKHKIVNEFLQNIDNALKTGNIKLSNEIYISFIENMPSSIQEVVFKNNYKYIMAELNTSA